MSFVYSHKLFYLALLVIILLLVVILVLSYSFFRRSSKLASYEKQYQVLEQKLKYLQLENLESRLDPHLFKNILNSVQSLAYQTYFSLDRMAGVLDYIMYDSKNKMVTLKQEHDFAIKLIDINKIKLNPLFRLDIRSIISQHDPLYEKELIAPLICIELIENAFKHADLQSQDSFISVLFKLKNGQFDLVVTNKASEKESLQKQNSGYGLQTLKQRLELIYGVYYKLEIQQDSKVYSIHLSLNLYDFKSKMCSS
ncbi:sensor histidine kinase [Myroides sp. LJL119]